KTDDWVVKASENIVLRMPVSEQHRLTQKEYNDSPLPTGFPLVRISKNQIGRFISAPAKDSIPYMRQISEGGVRMIHDEATAAGLAQSVYNRDAQKEVEITFVYKTGDGQTITHKVDVKPGIASVVTDQNGANSIVEYGAMKDIEKEMTKRGAREAILQPDGSWVYILKTDKLPVTRKQEVDVPLSPAVSQAIDVMAHATIQDFIDFINGPTFARAPRELKNDVLKELDEFKSMWESADQGKQNILSARVNRGKAAETLAIAKSARGRKGFVEKNAAALEFLKATVDDIRKIRGGTFPVLELINYVVRAQAKPDTKPEEYPALVEQYKARFAENPNILREDMNRYFSSNSALFQQTDVDALAKTVAETQANQQKLQEAIVAAITVPMNITRSAISGVGSHGTAILNELIQRGILIEVPSTDGPAKVRLNPSRDLNRTEIEEIVKGAKGAKGDADAIWTILQQSIPSLDNPNFDKLPLKSPEQLAQANQYVTQRLEQIKTDTDSLSRALSSGILSAQGKDEVTSWIANLNTDRDYLNGPWRREIDLEGTLGLDIRSRGKTPRAAFEEITALMTGNINTELVIYTERLNILNRINDLKVKGELYTAEATARLAQLTQSEKEKYEQAIDNVLSHRGAGDPLQSWIDSTLRMGRAQKKDIHDNIVYEEAFKAYNRVLAEEDEAVKAFKGGVSAFTDKAGVVKAKITALADNSRISTQDRGAIGQAMDEFFLNHPAPSAGAFVTGKNVHLPSGASLPIGDHKTTLPLLEASTLELNQDRANALFSVSDVNNALSGHFGKVTSIDKASQSEVWIVGLNNSAIGGRALNTFMPGFVKENQYQVQPDGSVKTVTQQYGLFMEVLGYQGRNVYLSVTGAMKFSGSNSGQIYGLSGIYEHNLPGSNRFILELGMAQSKDRKDDTLTFYDTLTQQPVSTEKITLDANDRYNFQNIGFVHDINKNLMFRVGVTRRAQNDTIFGMNSVIYPSAGVGVKAKGVMVTFDQSVVPSQKKTDISVDLWNRVNLHGNYDKDNDGKGFFAYSVSTKLIDRNWM
ncbi:MAG TPA: hypothetical protein VI955_03875, partial [Candidatus Omnitrophota bacterium]|nr:hypothetical protein [Candidatus Omnitrophota bacterium]